MFHDISIILHLPHYGEMSGLYQNHSLQHALATMAIPNFMDI